MHRIIKPEILDSLPEDDPDALHNRADIRKFNILMGNFRWFARNLGKVLRPNDRWIEIGAGSGDLGAYLAEKLKPPAIAAMDGLDLCARPSSWRENGQWFRTDLTEFDAYHRYPVVIANLVLHQFGDKALRDLGRKLARAARIIMANEPARRKLHLFQLKFGKLLGTNFVTDHDARVSIEAGFLGDELPRLLGLDPGSWAWSCRTGFLGQYRMIAWRRDVPTR